ncbi:MAG: o-succinylbenzoate--CoA ligase [Persicimonas sp.]
MKPWLEQRRRERPEARALSFEGTDLTYAQLADEAARRASALQSLDVDAGSRVAIVGRNSLEYVLWAHAVFWLGATLVPLHHRASRAELNDQCGVTQPTVVLAMPDAADRFDEAAPVVRVDDIASLIDDAPPAPPAEISSDDVLTILFTSGTTGTPRAVPLTVANHRASAHASALRLGCEPDDHWLCCLPLCHIGGLAIALRSAMYGTSFELMPRFDADAVLEVLASRPVTLASFVPTMLRRLLAASDGPLETRLRVVLVGGGHATAEELRTARQRGLPVVPTYGMTEAASQIATLAPGSGERWLQTAGRPLEGAEIRIGDPARPAEAGRSGAIYARGPMIADGYLGDEEASEERFRDGWLETGDVGHLDEKGRLVVEHRRGRRITTGGETVDPAEVERALRDATQVADAAVVGLDDAQWGARIAAAVVAADGGAAGLVDALEAHCEATLAPFKVPKEWMTLEELPRTSSGKVRRDLIRRLFTDP